MYEDLTLINQSMKEVLNQKQNIPNKTICFDIDNTLIDRDGKIIEPILDVHTHAKNLGYNIIIVTARVGTHENIEYTKNELLNHNITYNFIYFAKPGKNDYWMFKRHARQHAWEHKGFHIVASVGDQLWDIGIYGGRGFLVPIK